MTYKVRVKCGVCKTINVSATDVHDPSKRKHPRASNLTREPARKRFSANTLL